MQGSRATIVVPNMPGSCLRFVGVVSAVSVYWCVMVSVVAAVVAQPRDTVRVDLSRPEAVSSRYPLWQNAVYRWTVVGRGNIGQIQEIDARFVRNALVPPVTGLPERPKLPLSDNGTAGAQACQQPANQGLCDIYFATNALRTSAFQQPPQLDRAFRVSNAAGMRPYAFVPDNDTLQDNATYTLSVRGADIPAQFIFVEQLGGANVYGDNFTNNRPTTFTVLVERVSPELMVLDVPTVRFGTTTLTERRAQILNDVNLQSANRQVYRRDTIDFGSLAQGDELTITRELRNRGINPLQILAIRRFPANINFRFLPSGTEGFPRTLERERDINTMDFTFSPRMLGAFEDSVVIATNDPTQTPDGRGGFTFTFVLRGRCVERTLLTTLIDLNFDDVRVQSPPASRLVALSNSGSTPIVLQRVLPPVAPFSFQVNAFLPATLQPGNLLPISGTFAPVRFGNASAVAVIQGENMPDVRVLLRGRGVQSAVAVQNAQAPAADTIDFGAISRETSSDRVVVVQNLGNLGIIVRPTLEVSPNGSALDPTEFRLVDFPPRDSSIEEGGRREALIRFRAEPNSPLGAREAILNVQIVENDARIPVQTRRFILIGRLTSVFAAERESQPSQSSEHLWFDSVYVGRERRQAVSMRNISRQPITLVRQAILPIAPTVASEFAMDSLRQRVFASNQRETLVLRYTPNSRGRDTAMYEARYDTPMTLNEFTRIFLSGVGVEQQFDLVSAFPDPPFARASVSVLRGRTAQVFDTVDVGDVRVGTEKTVNIVFRNNGNLPYQVRNQFPTAIAPRTVLSDGVMRIQSAFGSRGGVAVGADDNSLVVRFRPTSEGEVLLQYTIESDIQSRIPTAPDSVLQRVFIIRGRGVQPVIVVPTTTVRFDNVLFTPTCNNTVRTTVPISNRGTAELLITNILIERSTSTAVFALDQTTLPSFSLAAGTSASITVQFTPPNVGRFAEQLLILSNAPPPNDTVRLRLEGSSVARASVSLQSDSLRVRPGTEIRVPILVSSTAATNPLTRVSQAEFQLSFDETLLEYVGQPITGGTASEGAESVSVTPLRGGIRLRLANQSKEFLPRTRLVELRFKTYLGTQMSSALSLSNVRFGNANCAELLEVAGTRNGIVQLDSVCNLEAKVNAGTLTVAITKHFAPNPVESEAELEFEVLRTTKLRLVLFNAQGEQHTVLAEGEYRAGHHTVRLPRERLSSGVYFYELRAGAECQRGSVVVWR